MMNEWPESGDSELDAFLKETERKIENKRLEMQRILKTKPEGWWNTYSILENHINRFRDQQDKRIDEWGKISERDNIA